MLPPHRTERHPRKTPESPGPARCATQPSQSPDLLADPRPEWRFPLAVPAADRVSARHRCRPGAPTAPAYHHQPATNPRRYSQAEPEGAPAPSWPSSAIVSLSLLVPARYPPADGMRQESDRRAALEGAVARHNAGYIETARARSGPNPFELPDLPPAAIVP